MPVSLSVATSDTSNSISYLSYEKQNERVYLLSTDKNKVTDSGSTELSSEDEDGRSTNRPTSGIKEASVARKVLVMIACLYLHMTAFGMIVVLAVVYVELIAVFESSREVAALVQSFFMGTAVGGGVLFSGVINKYRPGDLIMTASLISTIALFASSFSPNIETVIVLVGVVGGLAVSINVLGAFVVVSWIFADRRKMALGILTLGATLGQVMMPPIANALIVQYTWGGAMIVLSAIATLNCLPCGLLIRYSEEFYHRGSKESKTKTNLLDCLTDIPFILFLVFSFIFPATVIVEQLFSVDLAVSRGFGPNNGALLLSINGVFGFLGRISATAFLTYKPNIRPEIPLAISFITWAFGHFFVIRSMEYWQMALSMTLRGLSAGFAIAFLPSLQIDLRGKENYPQTVAMCNLFNGVGQLLGGFLGGLSVDETGTYDLIFYIATIASLYCSGSLMVIYGILKYRRHKSGINEAVMYQKL